jgi:tetratricopeptide (TPR) repeat protein
MDKVDKNKKKDIWDVLSSMSGLFTFLSSIVIAWLGVQFTDAYKKQEVRIAEAQTVEKFLPHLSSQNEGEKRGAILALATLNNKELAARLGALYASSGTIEALEIILKNAEGDSQTLLKDSLIEAYDNRGDDLYTHYGDLDRVIASYNRIHELQTDDYIFKKWGPSFLSLIYVRRGNAYREQDSYAQAINDYQKAVQILPNDSLAYSNLGKTYRYEGDFVTAILNHDKAIAMDPSEGRYYCERGKTYEEKGDLDKSLDDYNKAVSVDPREDCYYYRALFYLSKGNRNQAAADFEMTLKVTDDQKWRERAELELRNLPRSASTINKQPSGQARKVTGTH